KEAGIDDIVRGLTRSGWFGSVYEGRLPTGQIRRTPTEGLMDVGLEYIGKYGADLRSLSLTLVGNSNAGLVKLSEGFSKLRKLKLKRCPFSKQVVTSSVFNIPSLRKGQVEMEVYRKKVRG
ncbi:leucine-rich repeat, cysteine-containing subtype protein, partial [Tanacetum coccineum]